MPTDDQLSNELKNTERVIAADKYFTAQKKVQFANEIKRGLGDEIKKNPGAIKVIKKSWGQRFKLFLKGIFTKF